jgi:hypothetical protein
MAQTEWKAGSRGIAAAHLLLSGLLDPIRGFAVLIGRERVR